MTKLRVIEEFLHYLKSTDKSENTIRNYQCDLSNFANWFHDINNEQLTLPKLVRNKTKSHVS